MSKKMLIDATHEEETRVVVLDNGRLDELDVDTSTKKQIKGNIYLAKVVRVEPSLQAAFVDYGGNRHGFLAFGEIHPDYYQIPTADKEALKELMMAKEDEEHHEESDASLENEGENTAEVEVVSESETEETHVKRPAFFKKYKIQEVIRQGQVMLIQVVKEERGNKGAALTTYLSLAGRFSVLMPNNGKGGGVSRKITNAKERKTLRQVVDKLPIPKGMSVIIRTAGAGKTKAEIKRDFDYLIKTWMNIRDNTLESMAPKLIHQEGDIIKRSLRDVFTTDIEEIWVEGDAIFKTTKEFMKILMPGQVKKIKQYKGDVPLFQSYQVENQLESIHSNVVQLKSGGYLVIDQTEALVAVDVNSGRATKERDIEETALRTNLETCDELARQLKLRDLAGLIVIDFIDMDEAKNNAAVERRLKEALKKDRARIQVGKISGFGLMEMSRQRLHSSFLESSYKVCPHCAGKGLVRLVESCATHTLYLLEEAAQKNSGNTIILSLPLDVASYVLNNKRTNLSKLEEKYGVIIRVLGDGSMEKNSDFRLERLRTDGDRSMIQLNHGAAPVHNPQKSEKTNKKDRREDKKEEAKEPTEKTEMPLESDPTALEGDNKGNSRRSRNRRRREWKRRRQAERQAEAENNPASSLIQSEEHALVVRDEKPHLPAVPETERVEIKTIGKKEEHQTDPLNNEEKFTVVEQESLVDFGADKPRKNSTRGRRSKVQTKTNSSVSKVQEKADTIQPEGSDTRKDAFEPALQPQKKTPKRLTKKSARGSDKTNKTVPDQNNKTDSADAVSGPSTDLGDKKPKVSAPVDLGAQPAAENSNETAAPVKKRGGWWNKLVS